MTNIQATLRWTAAVIVLIGAFAWPALLNGQPFFFPDTTAYVRGADAGIQAIFKRKSAWSARESQNRTSVSSIEDKTVLTGRSPYYGALLYIGDLSGGFWLTVAIQALAVLVAIKFALDAARMPLWPHFVVISVFIAAATTAPFFVSLLMPDVFAGIAILAASVLLAVRQRLPAGDYVVALVLLVTACVVHDSHVLILFCLLSAAAVYDLVTRSWTNWIGLMIIALALVISGIAQSLFFRTVEHMVGAPPLRPPFLMARTIEDGPGIRYIHATCPASGFEVCKFSDRLPLIADDFLWKLGVGGVFASASPETRRKLSNEQVRFVGAVFAYDPWGQVAASLKDAAAQFTLLGLTEFHYTELEKEGFAAKVPVEHLKTLYSSAAYRGTMPVRLFTGLTSTVVVIAGLIVILALVRPQRLSGQGSPRLAISLWIVIGIVVNSAVCGILSGPHDRYSARVAWLLPLVALLLADTVVMRTRRTSLHVAAQSAAER